MHWSTYIRTLHFLREPICLLCMALPLSPLAWYSYNAPSIHNFSLHGRRAYQIGCWLATSAALNIHLSIIIWLRAVADGFLCSFFISTPFPDSPNTHGQSTHVNLSIVWHSICLLCKRPAFMRKSFITWFLKFIRRRCEAKSRIFTSKNNFTNQRIFGTIKSWLEQSSTASSSMRTFTSLRAKVTVSRILSIRSWDPVFWWQWYTFHASWHPFKP